jgi:hypothetical protein
VFFRFAAITRVAILDRGPFVGHAKLKPPPTSDHVESLVLAVGMFCLQERRASFAIVAVGILAHPGFINANESFCTTMSKAGLQSFAKMQRWPPAKGNVTPALSSAILK